MPRKNKNKGRRKETSEPQCSRILISCPDVKIEYKSPNSFLPTIETNELTIVELRTGNNVKIYLETGQIIYELVRGVTAYSRPDKKTFVLSNLIEETSVKLLFLNGSPLYLCDNFHRVLQDILQNSETVVNRNSHVDSTIRPVDGYISAFDAIVGGSQFIAQGLVSGAESVSKLIDHGTPALIDTITPEEKPTEVDPSLKVGLKFAKGIIHGVAVTSQLKTSAVAAFASSAGQFLAPRIKKLGTEILTSDYNYSADEAEHTVEKALEVTAGVATGIATVFDGFLSACSILGDSISRNAVEVVKHKYGDAAADATNDALGIVANVASTRVNEKRIQKRQIALQTAREIYPTND